ncbi:MAG: InlB B-repeat-containing protein, partial [Clostridiales bacterium]|nr:InlB B-repeat-containing protein [Clostridiales bacterium]
MMNRSSSRLIAWLLAMVMIFNISPITALAESSDPVGNPTYGDLSEVTVTYEASGWKWGVKNVRGGDEATPTQDDFNYYPTLVGWSNVSNYNGSNGVFVASGKTINLNELNLTGTSVTMYAVDSILVQFNAGSYGFEHDETRIFVVPGHKVSKPTKIPKGNNGQEFKEWTLNGQAYDFDSAVTEPITLEVSFATYYNVHFQYNGSDVATAQKVEENGTATKPADPEISGVVFKEWQLNGTAYNFDTPVTADLYLQAACETVSADQSAIDYNGEYTIKYAFNGKTYNYFGDEDIEIKRETASGNPNDNVQKQIEQSYVDDGTCLQKDPMGYAWDPESNTLTLYYKPNERDFTIHYRRELPDGTSQDLNQNTAPGTYGYKGDVDHTITQFNGKRISSAMGFKLPDTWIDVDKEHFTFRGYIYKNEIPSNITTTRPIYWTYQDQVKIGNTGNTDIFFYYKDEADTVTKPFTITVNLILDPDKGERTEAQSAVYFEQFSFQDESGNYGFYTNRVKDFFKLYDGQETATFDKTTYNYYLDPDRQYYFYLHDSPLELESIEIINGTIIRNEFPVSAGVTAECEFKPAQGAKNVIINIYEKGSGQTNKDMTVTAVSYEAPYDGATHNGGATAKENGVVLEGVTFQYSTDNGQTWSNTAPSIKDVGNISYKVKATKEGYNEAITTGKLTITKATLTITVVGGKTEATYDGTEKKAEGYTATSESTLFDASKIVFTGTDSVAKTDAGTYPMGLA